MFQASQLEYSQQYQAAVDHYQRAAKYQAEEEKVHQDASIRERSYIASQIGYREGQQEEKKRATRQLAEYSSRVKRDAEERRQQELMALRERERNTMERLRLQAQLDQEKETTEAQEVVEGGKDLLL